MRRGRKSGEIEAGLYIILFPPCSVVNLSRRDDERVRRPGWRTPEPPERTRASFDRGIVKNRHLAQAISDVACAGFFTMTKSKAEDAGRTFERVDPRYTSQICSNCGHRQKMPLTIRVYEWCKCGFVIGCDHNSAITTARAGQARIYARGDGVVAHQRSGNMMAELNPHRGVD